MILGRGPKEDMMNPVEHQNIILTGFMGTGKTTAGRVLAKCLGWKFVDTDDLVEKEAGKSIRDIFKDDGEDVFRGLERQVAAGIREFRHHVVATGGGIVLDPVNMRNLGKSGLLILLMADVDSIWSRIRCHDHRPLLQCEDPRSRIGELLKERSVVYNQIPQKVETGDVSIEKIVDQILKLVKHV